jgi:TOMM propeptide domain
MPTFQELYITKRLERERQVLSQVINEPGTRKDLLENPKATLESIYGVSFPAGTDIRVHEERLGSHYVVLPASIGETGEELSDDQLEAVAGGWFVQLLATSVCFGSGDPGGTSIPEPV